MSDRCSLLTLLVFCLLTAAPTRAAPPGVSAPRMTIVVGKDVSGSIYKKLGLPSRQICWDSCLKDSHCGGARWGAVDRDTAGMCVLMTGDLTLKDPVELKTEDGKPIHVVAARKESPSGAP
jgi:hypothetical protein